jgi:peptide deformylase
MPKILPIEAYGNRVLRTECKEINGDYPGLQELIEDMFETMYQANGVGLAAPQVGKSIRLFIVDASPFAEPDEEGKIDERAIGLKDFKKVFINPEILEEEGESWVFEEGCLSIPDIREDVTRESDILLGYFDQDFNYHEERYSGFAARVIQHEYDHIEGVLFTDYLKPLKKRLLQRKLNDIKKGIVDVKYKMRFAKLKTVK